MFENCACLKTFKNTDSGYARIVSTMFQLVYYFFYFLHLKKYKHGLGEYILEQSLSVTLLFFFFPLLLFLESTRPSGINENNYMIEF